MSKKRVHKIYRITFAHDGAQYVGRTCRPLKVRINNHGRHAKGPRGFRKTGNREVYNRLRAGEEYELEVLFDGLTEAQAKAYELAQIRLLDKPINCCGITRPPVWRHGTPPAYVTANRPEGRPRKEGVVRCSLCHSVLPTSEFYAERTRHNGLGSRCKDCVRILKREMSRSLRKEGSGKPGYWRGKAICKGKADAKAEA